VEVELAENAVLRQHPLGRRDLVEIGLVVDAGIGLDARVDHAEPHDVEAVAPEEDGVVAAEAGRRRVVGRPLVHHVDAVQDHDAALGVGDPAARVAERRGG
jgi:hypothetical protein